MCIIFHAQFHPFFGPEFNSISNNDSHLILLVHINFGPIFHLVNIGHLTILINPNLLNILRWLCTLFSLGNLRHKERGHCTWLLSILPKSPETKCIQVFPKYPFREANIPSSILTQLTMKISSKTVKYRHFVFCCMVGEKSFEKKEKYHKLGYPVDRHAA